MLRLVLAAVTYALAYKLGYLLRVPPSNLAAVWPATGVALGFLVNARSNQDRLATGAALAVANVAASLAVGNSPVFSLAFLAATVVEAVLASAILTRLGSRVPTLTSVPDVIALVLASTVGNFVTALVGGYVVAQMIGWSWSDAYRRWWASNGLGMLLVTPLVLVVLQRSLRAWIDSLQRRVEGGAFLVLWTLATILVFHGGQQFSVLAYALVALLVWAGLRLGTGTMALATCIVGISASTSELVGYGPSPFGGADPATRLLLMQVYLGVTATTGLVLAAARRETQSALATAVDEQTRMHTLANHLADIAIVQLTFVDGQPRFLYASAGIRAIAGLTPAEMMADAATFFARMHTGDRELLPAPLNGRPASHQSQSARGDVRIPQVSGVERWVTFSLAPRETRPGRVVWDGVILDVTETRRAQEAVRASDARLQEAQRMKLVGQLAGGIAHDFNNLLTVIMGYADTLRDHTAGSPRVAVERILAAAKRASSLTHQLLATGRRVTLAPVVFDLNDLVAQSESFVRRTVGETIAVDIRLPAEELRALIDPRQIERVLLNLVLNARDAMPNGGRLSVSTGSCEVDAVRADRHGVQPGRFVLIAVSDTGVGMTEEVRSRLFEPFFTTKDVGHGSGLGLAAVGGIVSQSNGFVEVDSSVGGGSTFRVMLPACLGPSTPLDADASITPRRLAGTEMVLVIEDDAAVRDLVQRTLERHGYRVKVAASGTAALELVESADSPIDIVVCDVMLPGWSGPETMRHLRAHVPGLKVLFVSGYSDDVVESRGVSRESEQFLQKPFSAALLVARLRAILDA